MKKYLLLLVTMIVALSLLGGLALAAGEEGAARGRGVANPLDRRADRLHVEPGQQGRGPLEVVLDVGLGLHGGFPRGSCPARIVHEFISTRSASEGRATVCPRLRFGLVFGALRRRPWFVNNPG